MVQITENRMLSWTRHKNENSPQGFSFNSYTIVETIKAGSCRRGQITFSFLFLPIITIIKVPKHFFQT